MSSWIDVNIPPDVSRHVQVPTLLQTYTKLFGYHDTSNLLSRKHLHAHVITSEQHEQALLTLRSDSLFICWRIARIGGGNHSSERGYSGPRKSKGLERSILPRSPLIEPAGRCPSRFEPGAFRRCARYRAVCGLKRKICYTIIKIIRGVQCGIHFEAESKKILLCLSKTHYINTVGVQYGNIIKQDSEAKFQIKSYQYTKPIHRNLKKGKRRRSQGSFSLVLVIGQEFFEI